MQMIKLGTETYISLDLCNIKHTGSNIPKI